jgi:thiamine-monophosphate kinase
MAGKPAPANEVAFLRSIERLVFAGGRRPRNLILPIGDDAAAFRVRPGCQALISTDALVEGVHFDLSYFSPEDLGWKALAVNLSDIAAMGGRPTFFTTSLAVPRGTSAQFLKRLYRGMLELARETGVTLIGGDTCSSPSGLFLDVTILGEVEPSKMVTRQGGRPGDLLYVSGALGGSAIGLEFLKRRIRPSSGGKELSRRHLRPRPRLELARKLIRRCAVNAMIDLSDGLSTDLNHLARESRVGAIICAEKIPTTPLSSKLSSLLPASLLHYSLNGGEDYELLFSVPARDQKKVPRELDGIPITEIGHLTGGKPGCWISTGGKQQPLPPSGYDHFS